MRIESWGKVLETVALLVHLTISQVFTVIQPQRTDLRKSDQVLVSVFFGEGIPYEMGKRLHLPPKSAQGSLASSLCSGQQLSRVPWSFNDPSPVLENAITVCCVKVDLVDLLIHSAAFGPIDERCAMMCLHRFVLCPRFRRLLRILESSGP